MLQLIKRLESGAETLKQTNPFNQTLLFLAAGPQVGRESLIGLLQPSGWTGSAAS